MYAPNLNSRSFGRGCVPIMLGIWPSHPSGSMLASPSEIYIYCPHINSANDEQPAWAAVARYQQIWFSS